MGFEGETGLGTPPAVPVLGLGQQTFELHEAFGACRLPTAALALEAAIDFHLDVLLDGAPWIWHVAADRWASAQELLDFYHASEHLWELGRALFGPEQAKEWVEARLHELRHGQEEHCLEALAELKPPRGEKGQIVREQQNYFAGQSQRMNYHQIAQRGWPIGSGAVESACSGHQNRFKRRGQFWTRPGLAHLAALKQARQNNHWDQLWFVEYWWYRQDAPGGGGVLPKSFVFWRIWA